MPGAETFTATFVLEMMLGLAIERLIFTFDVFLFVNA
jgi:hypothetical protein